MLILVGGVALALLVGTSGLMFGVRVAQHLHIDRLVMCLTDATGAQHKRRIRRRDGPPATKPKRRARRRQQQYSAVDDEALAEDADDSQCGDDDERVLDDCPASPITYLSDEADNSLPSPSLRRDVVEEDAWEEEALTLHLGGRVSGGRTEPVALGMD
jgi:hypothetical protein